MKTQNSSTKILAIGGTILVWLPILAPIIFSVVSAMSDRRFRFDYLMPAEFFPLAFLGGALLVWVAIRTHAYQKLIGWCLGIASGLLIGGQVLAVVTGLASGQTEPEGLWWFIVLGTLLFYSLAVVALGVGGLLVLRNLFRSAFRH
jgi:hypothetical protein